MPCGFQSIDSLWIISVMCVCVYGLCCVRVADAIRLGGIRLRSAEMRCDCACWMRDGDAYQCVWLGIRDADQVTMFVRFIFVVDMGEIYVWVHVCY